MTTPDFEALLKVLVTGEVEFVLVGGYSAMLHGSSLMTRDVEIVCPMHPEQLTRLWHSLEPFTPIHRTAKDDRPFTSEDASRKDWKNLYLRTELGVLDCLGEVKGLGDYQACLSRSTTLKFGEITIQTLTLEALIEAKRAMGRPRDLHTADELELIQQRQKP